MTLMCFAVLAHLFDLGALPCNSMIVIPFYPLLLHVVFWVRVFYAFICRERSSHVICECVGPLGSISMARGNCLDVCIRSLLSHHSSLFSDIDAFSIGWGLVRMCILLCGCVVFIILVTVSSSTGRCPRWCRCVARIGSSMSLYL